MVMTGRSAGIRFMAIAAVLFVAVGAVSPLFSDCSDATAEVTVVDGYGKVFTFTDEPSHVVTIGKGITATVIQLGGIHKIVVADSYSRTDNNSIFDPLRTQIDSGKTVANGNIYGGSTALTTDIVYAADNHLFDRESDPVFITGGNSYIQPIVESLVNNGFKKVMAWNDITEYSDIPDFVSTISKILDGTESDLVTQMRHTSDVIEAGILGHTVREAFYVTYSGGVFKVGNTNSLANSMISAAGGLSVTTDDSKAKPTYEANITTLVIEHPDAIIFIDNSINSNEAQLNSLKSAIGTDSYDRVVPLNPLWNNYSVESMNGIWTMACAMYPDLFSGDVPGIDKSTQDNIVVYFSVSSIAALAICVGGVVFLRRA
ncbi:MAG: hypothetical protein J5707_04795 [Candidatus Methanomethylophilus sp.]|nr:hypothetical protein [Methanomethylophilus sp.]